MTSLETTFVQALESRGGTGHLVPDEESARRLLHGLCAGKRVAADDDTLLVPLIGDLERVQDPWDADIGVTTAVAAAAATSTLALAFDASHRRRTALVPPVHIAVVPVDRLVGTYAEALAAVAALSPPPSGIRMASGPSSSGDIEQVHIRGMHGPIEVHVVLLGADTVDVAPDQAVEGDEQPVAEPVHDAAPDAAPGQETR